MIVLYSITEFSIPSYGQLAVQGPLALKAMQKLTDTPIEDMEYYTFKYLTFAGIENVLLSTTGYTGAGGCEIYFDKQYADKIWDAVFEAGQEFGIKPAGFRNSPNRVSKSYKKSPAEAGLFVFN